MLDEFTLFAERDVKDVTIKIRLTKRQKERVYLMAKSAGVSVSRLVLGLIASESARMIDVGLLDIWDDGMPF